MTIAHTLARTPRDLSQFALRAAMSLDAVRSHRDADTSVVGEFFSKLFEEFGLQASHPQSVRSLMPTHRYVMSRALSDVGAPSHDRKDEPERMWQDLLVDINGIVRSTANEAQVAEQSAERLMRFCLAIHQELLHQREQRLYSHRHRR